MWTSCSGWAPAPAVRSSPGACTGTCPASSRPARYPEVKAPIHLVYGEKDWSRPSDREADKRLLPTADFTQVPEAGHFISLERPDVLADLLNAANAEA